MAISDLDGKLRGSEVGSREQSERLGAITPGRVNRQLGGLAEQLRQEPSRRAVACALVKMVDSADVPPHLGDGTHLLCLVRRNVVAEKRP